MNRLIKAVIAFLITFCISAGEREEAAWDFLKKKNYPQALSLFSSLSRQAPENIYLKIGIARTKQGMGKLTEAEGLFRQLRQQENQRKHQPPTDFCGHLQIELGLATCLDLTGDVEKLTEAEGLFRQLRQQENQRKHQPPTDFCGHLQIELGLLACLDHQTDNVSKADQLATILLEAFATSHNWQLFHVIAVTRFTLACREIITGSVPDTNKNLQAAMALVKRSRQEKETPQSLSLQGHILRMMGDGQQATIFWARANILQTSRQQARKQEAWRELEHKALDRLQHLDIQSKDTGQPLSQPPCPQHPVRPGLNPQAPPFVPGKIWSQ